MRAEYLVGRVLHKVLGSIPIPPYVCVIYRNKSAHFRTDEKGRVSTINWESMKKNEIKVPSHPIYKNQLKIKNTLRTLN